MYMAFFSLALARVSICKNPIPRKTC